MASVGGIFAAICKSGLTYCSSSKQCTFLLIHHPTNIQSSARISMVEKKITKKVECHRLLKSVQMDVSVTSDDEGERSQVYREAIDKLERMAREPSDVLEEMNDKLSDRELQLVLLYFAQEGRDSWCALEVFEWLKKENRVGKETMELMVSIMCSWFKKLIEGRNGVEDVVDLLVDMDCVGLKTSFSMIDMVISMYWEAGEKDGAILFVKEVLRREVKILDGVRNGIKGSPAGYLASKMMEEGNYRDTAKLVIHLRKCGLKPEVDSYLIAMKAVVNELNEFNRALCHLKSFNKVGVGLVTELDMNSIHLIENYQQELITDGLHLSNWVIKEGGPKLLGEVQLRLLAMYVAAGRGREAEKQLWEMKLVGKEADADIYDKVLGICASQKETRSIGRLLTQMDFESSSRRKEMLSSVLIGYIKGGHFENAAETVIKMLDLGLHPEFLDRFLVLQGLGRRIQQTGNVDPYLTLCKRLSDANLIGPVLVYLHLIKQKLWIIKML